jgi:hypothetical protein
MNVILKSPLTRAAFAVAIVVAVSISAAAQARVRVVKDSAIIWRREARIPVTTLKAGTVLDVVAREGDWYIVLVPPESGGTGETGMIAASQVEAVAGSSPRAGTERGPARPAAPARRGVALTSARPVEVFGSGQLALTKWLAHDTFNAVLGHSVAPLFGGGVEVHLRDRVFIEGAVERFQQTGQRVFVSNGDVFKLGIRDTVRVIPVSVTAGYRHGFRTVTSYVGGGAGMYFYRETSDLADPSENISDRFASYHALAGVEFGGRGVVRTAFEVQITTVPNALGPSGASAAFGERNLGGVQFRLKVMAGR